MGSGWDWDVSFSLRTLSIKDLAMPLSFFSMVARLVIKLLEPLKASTAFWMVALSAEDMVLEFNNAGAVSEKNLPMFW